MLVGLIQCRINKEKHMDTQRLLLFAAFAMVSLMLWQSWQVLHNPQLAQTPQAAHKASNPGGQQSTSKKGLDRPEVPQESTRTNPVPARNTHKAELSKTVHVKTDVLDIIIDTRGADVVKARLLKYPQDNSNAPFVLMNTGTERFFISQTGLLNKDQLTQYAPDHHTVFTTARDSYELGQKEKMEVRFQWLSRDGKMQLIKSYTFNKGRYDILVRQQIINKGEQTLNNYAYRQLQRNNQQQKSHFLRTYTGGMLYRDGGGFEKYKFEDMQEKPLQKQMKSGWLAIIEHYFLASWIPQKETLQHYYSRTYEQDGQQRFILGMTSDLISVAPGQKATIQDTLYIGPKLQSVLKQIAPNLDDTVDYGFLAVIGHPIFWLMVKIHGVVQNWGWSIILLTLVIKLLFFKLSEYSYRSMAQMRKLGPKLKALQEQHKDNPQAKNQAMMKLYKEEKINPLGGCLPVLVQIPVFIALYWVLLESVELRHADFLLWLDNLSAPDPYFILPLVMGITMFAQQKLNPAPTDPIQAKVMMALPIVFTVFFAFFPAGLVLYWVTNNILSIAQQWYITRQIEAG